MPVLDALQKFLVALDAAYVAAASAAMRVSQAWYVKPARFDPSRFSEGIGETRYFQIDLPRP